jgi:hypothetical protein
MKVPQLRRLRTLSAQMRLAPSADSLEWYARRIADIVKDIDAGGGNLAAPTERERIGTFLVRSEDDAAPDSNGNPAEKPCASAAPPTAPMAAIATRGEPTVSRETPARQPRARPAIVRHSTAASHPIFRDDPIAVAESEAEHRTFSLRFGWR